MPLRRRRIGANGHRDAGGRGMVSGKAEPPYRSGNRVPIAAAVAPTHTDARHTPGRYFFRNFAGIGPIIFLEIRRYFNPPGSPVGLLLPSCEAGAGSATDLKGIESAPVLSDAATAVQPVR